MISKQALICEKIGVFAHSYKKIKEIGSGTYGVILQVQSKITGKFYACKKILKSSIKNFKRLKIELDILKAIDHPNIIKIFDLIEEENIIYIIMEECHGGELFDKIKNKIKEKTPLTEKECSRIFKQIIEAINYCHKHGICHRDLKPENILFETNEENSNLKIIDFGLSALFTNKENKKMVEFTGTLYYLAPEVIKGDYDEKCDIWSSGVILFFLLTGQLPFYGNKDEEVIKKILNFDYKQSESFNKISDDAKNLLELLLCSSEKRLNASQVLDHVWVKCESKSRVDSKVLNLELENTLSFINSNKLYQAVISFVAYRQRNDDIIIKTLIDIFRDLDNNQDGIITIKEFEDGLEVLKTKYDNLEEMNFFDLFNLIDLDRNDHINFTEFISSCVESEKILKTESIIEAFRAFDKDNSGKISKKEICDVIKPQNNEDLKNIEDLIEYFDSNKDGVIDLKEFNSGLIFKKE